MARELKEKDDVSRSSETPKHIFHNTPCGENTHKQFYSQPFLLAASNAMHQPSFSQGHVQTPFA